MNIYVCEQKILVNVLDMTLHAQKVIIILWNRRGY